MALQMRDLTDAVGVFHRTASIDNAGGLLQRVVDVLRTEPMRGFLASALPSAHFETWWLEKNGGQLMTSGRSAIDWPPERQKRVALQIDFCTYLLADGKQRLFTFAHRHFHGGTNNVSANLRNLATHLLDELVRDITRLAEQRPLSAPLSASLQNRPTSPDAILDGLLSEACDAFRDPAPAKQYEALKHLWDAFERTKTLDSALDKKQGVQALVAATVSDEAMKAVLLAEMKALSDIGNNFHIRHFETNRAPLSDPAQVDYLFHRMLALLQLLLKRAP